jgi:hypothetical protein
MDILKKSNVSKNKFLEIFFQNYGKKILKKFLIFTLQLKQFSVLTAQDQQQTK